MIPIIEKEKCTACGNCADICPPGAITLDNEAVCIAADLCEECGFCVTQCPVGAITIRFPMSLDR